MANTAAPAVATIGRRFFDGGDMFQMFLFSVVHQPPISCVSTMVSTKREVEVFVAESGPFLYLFLCEESKLSVYTDIVLLANLEDETHKR